MHTEFAAGLERDDAGTYPEEPAIPEVNSEHTSFARDVIVGIGEERPSDGIENGMGCTSDCHAKVTEIGTEGTAGSLYMHVDFRLSREIKPRLTQVRFHRLSSRLSRAFFACASWGIRRHRYANPIIGESRPATPCLSSRSHIEAYDQGRCWVAPSSGMQAD